MAWGWAVNGFFSVIGSVLTTMLSMTFGFRAVQLGAVAMYGIAVLAFTSLGRHEVVDLAADDARADVEPRIAATLSTVSTVSPSTA